MKPTALVIVILSTALAHADGAIVRSGIDGRVYVSYGHPTAAEARANALATCARTSGAILCDLIKEFRNTCMAAYADRSRTAHFGYAPTKEAANEQAFSECSRRAAPCTPAGTFCDITAAAEQAPAAPQVEAPFGLAVSGMLTALLFAVLFWRKIVTGFYHLFVKHSATDVVMPVVGTSQPIDATALNQALTPLPRHLHSPPSAHHSRHLTERALAMSAKLDADAEIARAAEERARAQAALKDAERRLAEAERKRRR